MQCKKCGNKLNIDKLYCSNCGSKIDISNNKNDITNKQYGKNNNFLFKTIIVFIAFLLIYGCYVIINLFFRPNPEEEKYKQQLNAQASINAKKYIMDKYGFDANIISFDNNTYCDPEGCLFGEKISDYVYVKMKYNNEKFTVVISGKEENPKGYDNYQYTVILQELLNEINIETNLKPYKINLSCIGWNNNFRETNSKHSYCLINQKYNGTNIKEFITNEISSLSIIVEYINERDLEFIKKDNLLEEYDNMHILLINYNSINDFNSLTEREQLFRNNGINYYPFIKENKDKIESAIEIYTDENGKQIKYYKNGEKKI